MNHHYFRATLTGFTGLATAIAMIPGQPAIAQSRPQSKPSVMRIAQVSNFQQEILLLVNAERRKVGLSALTLNAKLNQAAQTHTNDMVAKKYFSHTSPSGSTMVSRVKATGYVYSTIGENIAAGNGTAAGTMTQWMNSPGHRANILNPKFKELGVGYAPSTDPYKHYWTQVFGAPR